MFFIFCLLFFSESQDRDLTRPGQRPGEFLSVLDKNCILEAREVSKTLPEARGSVLAKYQPVASHGDPIRAQNDGKCDNM